MIEKNIVEGDIVTVKVRTFPQLASDRTVEIKKAQVTRIGAPSFGNDGRTWHMLTLSLLDGGTVYVPALDEELAPDARPR